MRFSFEGSLWLSEGEAPWVFVTLPDDVSSEIRDLFGGQASGFGSLRVEAHLGGFSWRTSIFPDSKSSCYLLPVKAQVRRVAGVAPGDTVTVEMSIPMA